MRTVPNTNNYILQTRSLRPPRPPRYLPLYAVLLKLRLGVHELRAVPRRFRMSRHASLTCDSRTACGCCLTFCLT
jgi:hypothetical protein